MAERSLAGRRAQSRWATSAAAMARTVSALPQFGTVPICSPVAGLVTEMASRLSASAHSPAMKTCWRSRVESFSFSMRTLLVLAFSDHDSHCGRL